MAGRRLTGGQKTGFLDSKRRNIYMSENGRYYANGADGKRVYAPKARYISVNGSVRSLASSNVVPNKIRAKRVFAADRKSTRLNSSHVSESRMPSSA